MGRRKNAAIKRTGNAGNSKKGSKEEVNALIAAKKEKAAAAEAAAAERRRRTTTQARRPVAAAGGGGAGAAAGGPGTAAARKGAKDKGKAVAGAAAGGDDDGEGGFFNLFGGDAEEEPEPDHPRPIESGYDLKKWTGKTPQNQLYDYCARQNWFKPQFHTSNRNGGVTCRTVLGHEDKKEEKPKYRSYCDNRVYVNGMEAKHFASVYTLHQIGFDKPMHRVLPPGYKDYWLDLEDLRMQKVNTSKTGAWKTPLSPFEALPVRKPPPSSKPKKPKRTVPIVRMSESCRQLVENAIHSSLAKKSAQREPGTVDEALVGSVIRLGFRKEHVKEGATFASDRAALIDWLCLHVPEQDLPVKFKPKVQELTAANHDQASLAREYKARRLALVGFGHKDCLQALRACGDSEVMAMERLVQGLTDTDAPKPGPGAEDVAELEAMREEERESLKAILGKAFSASFEGETWCYRIRLECKLPGKTVLEARLHSSMVYPEAPLLAVVHNDKLPAYVRLSAVREMREQSIALVGELSVFELVTWATERLPELSKAPPPLATLKTFAGGDDPAAPVAIPAQRRGKKGGKGRRGGGMLPDSSDAESERLRRDAARRLDTDRKLKEMRRQRESLPAHKFRSTIVNTIRDSQVVVISGETGCGKTTQIPQFVLEDCITSGRGAKCNMTCTQPRRLSAMAVADRVAAERAERVGASVGYAIRLERRQSRETRLLFCTTGILLRQLQGDPDLNGTSHVFVDEVHERSVDSDILLALLRQVLRRRRDLKLILMSATLDSKRFSEYYDGAPVISIPGRTFPVQDFFLEDVIELTGFQSGGYGSKPRPKPKVQQGGKIQVKAAAEPAASETVDSWESLLGEDKDADTAGGEAQAYEYSEATMATISRMKGERGISYRLIAAAVKLICETEQTDGAVLIFMPGLSEIKRCCREIQQLHVDQDLVVLPLHSSVSPADQAKIFRRYGKRQRKIVVSTNIAETSITIDDVVYVIDSGRVKETQYDSQNNMMCLVETWVSQASAKQRRGRAGRVQAGKCFKLFTKAYHDEKMLPQQIPEIMRVPIEQLCLRVKVMDTTKLTHFISSLLDPPAEASIQSALSTLRSLSALDEAENATALGRHLATVPTDVRIGKFLLFGAILNCLDPILTIAACMSYRSPFLSPMEKREEAKKAKESFAFGKSDLLTYASAYEAWNDVRCSSSKDGERRFCDDHFLSMQTMYQVHELRKQYITTLADMGFISPAYPRVAGDLNANSKNAKVLKACLCAGLYPNVVRVQLPATTYKQMEHGAIAKDAKAHEIKLFPKEPGRVFLHPSSILFREGKFEDLHIIFHEKVQTSKVFLRDATTVSPYPLLLFGGKISVNHDQNTISVDDWIKFDAPGRIAVLVNELRGALDALLEIKIEHPEADVAGHPVVRAMIKLIVSDGL